jgi:glycosyltransferase involved in cell wall biosynthesis
MVDIQAAIAQRAGVGRYVKALVEHLAPLAGEDELDLFYFDFMRRGMPFPVPAAKQSACRVFPGRIVQAAWKKVAWPPFDWFSGWADVFHFPNFVRPPLQRGKSVVTIHDLAFMRHPDTIEPRNYAYLTSQIKQTVNRADRIIAVSEFTAREIEELLKVPRERIAVIYEGLTENVQKPDTAAIAAMRDQLGLARPYLLTVGTLEPRKNIPFLVNVFETLGDFDGDLVLAGMRGWKYEPILDWIQNSPRAAQIKRLDYVPESLLPALYSGAELFVFPSLYEGFGFPPLEAMGCGTPVVSATTGSLPEVLGDGCLYVDDFNEQSWADAIHDLLMDNSQRLSLSERGKAQAARFTWHECATKTWEVYRSLGGRRA